MEMTTYNALYIWICQVLFIIGILLLPVGLGFFFFHDRILELSAKCNRWISTDHFFYIINKPNYREHFFYQHRRIFSILIIGISSSVLYFMTTYAGMNEVASLLNKITSGKLEQSLFIALYYLLLVFNLLAIIVALIMLLHPVSLKTVEQWLNHWFDTDGPLEILNTQKELPTGLLSRNPRLFGLFILLGAIYIIWMTHLC